MQTDLKKDVIIYGTFIKELKNRFLCLVNINGEDTVCYVPSSCKLSNFLDLTNREVLLLPNSSKTARTKYSIYAVKIGRNYILLNLSYANKIVEQELCRRYFSFLGKRKNICHELTIEGYKTDLYIKDTNTIIEIKSILAFEKVAKFPTIYSERAINQLHSILKLLDRGYKVCYIFISMNPIVRKVIINRSIIEFYNLFMECISKGMKCCGYSIRLKYDTYNINSKIEIIL